MGNIERDKDAASFLRDFAETGNLDESHSIRINLWSTGSAYEVEANTAYLAGLLEQYPTITEKSPLFLLSDLTDVEIYAAPTMWKAAMSRVTPLPEPF